ncbi:uncharacterized protein Dwil_GK17406 [Drosophila willistoni]|uniref:DUF4794 domain-containing protein n=1 Tax=Drosophila willistoni TaxID=7260 RepID=B4MLW4_DROWI|nr:uncharacterized protein Dwil_GK17406 [Drosophila willistoni]
MRTLIVCALLAFLAISFVQARPNEEESDVSDSLVANTTENNVVNDSETTEADETEEEDEDDDEDSTADRPGPYIPNNFLNYPAAAPDFRPYARFAILRRGVPYTPNIDF